MGDSDSDPDECTNEKRYRRMKREEGLRQRQRKKELWDRINREDGDMTQADYAMGLQDLPKKIRINRKRSRKNNRWCTSIFLQRRRHHTKSHRIQILHRKKFSSH